MSNKVDRSALHEKFIANRSKVMLRSSVVFAVLFSFVLGCSGSKLNTSSVQDAQARYEKALELEGQSKFVEAIPEIDKAIQLGGLNPDQLSDAYLLRSRCYALTGKTELADQDFASAEQGAPNAVSLHFTKAVLLMKAGKMAESKAEFSKAQKINPKLKMPTTP